MTSYLVPYTDPSKIGGHADPVFEEFTYGDVRKKGKTLHDHVKEGDYLFFHKKINKEHAIPAYYYVKKVMLVSEAKKDKALVARCDNPHLHEPLRSPHDAIVFGDPKKSRILRHPYVIEPEKLSISSKSLLQPGFVALADKDVEYLLSEIGEQNKQGILGKILRIFGIKKSR